MDHVIEQLIESNSFATEEIENMSVDDVREVPDSVIIAHINLLLKDLTERE